MLKRTDIDSVIFDLGLVIINYMPRKYLEDLFPGEKDRAEAVFRATFGSPLWLMLDNGDFVEEEAIRRMILQTPELEADIRTAMVGWPHDMLSPLEAAQWLEKLKAAGYRLYVLSNISVLAFEYIRTTYGFMGCFDGMVASAAEKVSKPDPKIFTLLAERFGLEPFHSVFIDDSRKNTEAAEALGFCAINYTGVDDLKQFFE